MELNIDAIRAVLQYIKDNTTYSGSLRTGKQYFTQREIIKDIEPTKQYTSDDIAYSIELLIDTNLIQFVEPVKFGPTGELFMVKIRRLTIEGYSFLEQTQNPTVWEAIKIKAKATGQYSLKGLATLGATLGTAMLTDPNAIQNFIQGTQNVAHMIPGL